ncbi:MAG: polysaccharide deacetylase family protein [Vulcanimicrobiaceae bacterium]
MWMRRLVAVVLVASLGYAGWRLYRHAGYLARPVIVTPAMNAHEVVSPGWRRRLAALLYRPKSAPKIVALTFDDGPYPVTTPLLLAQLRRLGVPATFFYIGRDAVQWPGIVERTARDGIEIGDHTYTHPELDRESPAAIQSEVLRGRNALWKIAPDPAERSLMRPPHGRYRAATLRAIGALGYSVVLWSDDTGDWRSLTPSSIEQHVIARATRPEILLMHNGRLPTIEALPTIVAAFRAAGYRFVTVRQMLRTVPLATINHPVRRPLRG